MSGRSGRRGRTGRTGRTGHRGCRERRWIPGAAVLLALPLLAGWSFFDPFHEKVEKGNGLAAGGEADAALQQYDEAARVDPGSPIPDFNRGIVLSGQGKAKDAGNAFLGAAAAEDPHVAAGAFYNLGNVLMDSKQYEPAVEAYLKSLDLDPSDPDARRNLEIAMQRLQQQQQQQQQDQQNQDQKDQDKQKQDQKNQDQQNQSQDQQDKQDKQQQDQNQQNQDQQQKQDQQDQQNQDQQQSDDQSGEQGQQPPDEQGTPDDQKQPPVPLDQMSREDAERLLNAIQSDELKVLQKLQDDAQKNTGGVTDDW